MRPAIVARGRSLAYSTARNDLLALRRLFSSETRDGDEIERKVSDDPSGKQSLTQGHNGEVRQADGKDSASGETDAAEVRPPIGILGLSHPSGGRGRGSRLVAPIGAVPAAVPAAVPSIIGQTPKPEESARFNHPKSIVTTQGRGRGSVILKPQSLFRPQASSRNSQELALEAKASAASDPVPSSPTPPIPQASAASDSMPSSPSPPSTLSHGAQTSQPHISAADDGAQPSQSQVSTSEDGKTLQVGASEASLPEQASAGSPLSRSPSPPTSWQDIKPKHRVSEGEQRLGPHRGSLSTEAGLELAQKISEQQVLTRVHRPGYMTTFRGEGIQEKTAPKPIQRADTGALPARVVGVQPTVSLGVPIREKSKLGAGRGRPLETGSAGERARGVLLDNIIQARERERPTSVAPSASTAQKEMRRRRGSAEAFTGMYGDLSAGGGQKGGWQARGEGAGDNRDFSRREGGGSESSSRPRARQPRERRQRWQQQDGQFDQQRLSAREAAMAELSPEEKKQMEEHKEFEDRLEKFDDHMKREFEAEWFMADFSSNPILDEFLPAEAPPKEEGIRRFLEANKGTLMMSNSIDTQEEWEALVAQALEKLPGLERVVDHYGGPDRLTALQENARLAEFKDNLPPTVSPLLEKFIQRSITTLQNNPHWQLAEKESFLGSMARNVSAHAHSSS